MNRMTKRILFCTLVVISQITLAATTTITTENGTAEISESQLQILITKQDVFYLSALVIVIGALFALLSGLSWYKKTNSGAGISIESKKEQSSIRGSVTFETVGLVMGAFIILAGLILSQAHLVYTATLPVI